jgi:hypothetical protein
MPELLAEDDRSLLAGEYVLGTLDADERTRANELLDRDPQFGELVSTWERRLGELHLMVEPVEPAPEIWQRIKARGVPPSVAAPEIVPGPPAAAQEPAGLSQAEEIKSEETCEAEPSGTRLAAEPEFAQLRSGRPLPYPPPQAGEGTEGVEHAEPAPPAAAAVEEETAPAEQEIVLAKEETAVAKEETAVATEETVLAKQEPELVGPVAFQPPPPGPLPQPEPLPKPVPPAEPSRTLRLDILPDVAWEREKAAPGPERKEPLPGSSAVGWRAIAAAATIVAVALAGLIASWRYVPDRLPPQLRPTVLLNMTAQPRNAAGRPPLPEAQFQE